MLLLLEKPIKFGIPQRTYRVFNMACEKVNCEWKTFLATVPSEELLSSRRESLFVVAEDV